MRRLLNCRINNLRSSMILSCSCYVFWAPWPRECIQLPNICLERVLGIGYVCGHAAHQKGVDVLGTPARPLTPAAPETAASACAGLFALVIAFNARHWGSRYEERWLHGGCPFAGRTRLLKQGDASAAAWCRCDGPSTVAVARQPDRESIVLRFLSSSTGRRIICLFFWALRCMEQHGTHRLLALCCWLWWRRRKV